jgi:hypothetical protein
MGISPFAVALADNSTSATDQSQRSKDGQSQAINASNQNQSASDRNNPSGNQNRQNDRKDKSHNDSRDKKSSGKNQQETIACTYLPKAMIEPSHSFFCIKKERAGIGVILHAREDFQLKPSGTNLCYFRTLTLVECYVSGNFFPFHFFYKITQTIAAGIKKGCIDLFRIASKYNLGSLSRPGNKRFYFLGRKILCFVADNKLFGNTTPPNKS